MTDPESHQDDVAPVTRTPAAAGRRQQQFPPARRRASMTDPLGGLFNRRRSDLSSDDGGSAGGDVDKAKAKGGKDGEVQQEAPDLHASTSSFGGWGGFGGSFRGGLDFKTTAASSSSSAAGGGGGNGTDSAASTPSSRPKQPVRRASVTDILSNIMEGGGGNNNQSERDRRAAMEQAIQKVKDRKDLEIADLRSETTDLRAALNSASLHHGLQLEERNRQYRLMKSRLELLGRDMKDKDSIHEYCKMIKEAAPHRTDTQYVIKLQAQMAKVLHEMGVMGNQLSALKQGCDGVVASLHGDMAKIVHDKSKAEQQFINDLMALEGEKREIRDGYESQLHEKEGKIAQLQAKVMQLEIRNMVEDSGDDDDDDDGSINLDGVVVSGTVGREEEKKACDDA